MKKFKLFAVVLAVAIGVLCTSIASASTVPYVESDTTIGFTRPQNETYAFKFTVHGSHANPKIAAGNGNVLKTEDCYKVTESGNDVYYFKVRAIGEPGTSSAIYTTLPNESAVNHCVITVSQPIKNKGLKLVDVTKNVVKANETATLTINGKPNTPYTISVYYFTSASKAKGLEKKTSDAAGNVTWIWKVGGNTTPGKHRIVVNGGGEKIETSFVTA